MSIAAATLCAAAIAGCTAPESEANAPSSLPSLSADELSAAREHLVARRALPALDAAFGQLEEVDFVVEADGVDVQGQLDEAGFQGAVERVFRGRSRTITGAESRVLTFSSAAGAASFASLLAEHPDPFFGGPSLITPLRLGSLGGVVIEPPICDCPGAHPLFVGIVADGQRVKWLQVTGPRASPANLRTLLATT